MVGIDDPYIIADLVVKCGTMTKEEAYQKIDELYEIDESGDTETDYINGILLSQSDDTLFEKLEDEVYEFYMDTAVREIENDDTGFDYDYYDHRNDRYVDLADKYYW